MREPDLCKPELGYRPHAQQIVDFSVDFFDEILTYTVNKTRAHKSILSVQIIHYKKVFKFNIDFFTLLLK